MKRSLAQLDIGETARVVGVQGGDEISQRLLEMGEPDFDVHLVVLDLEGKPAKDVLKLASVSLDFAD